MTVGTGVVPTLTGTYTSLGEGEYLTLDLNGVSYTASSTELTLSGGDYTLIPASALPDGVYDVVATIWDADGFASYDTTNGELTVGTPMTISGTIRKGNGDPLLASVPVSLYLVSTTDQLQGTTSTNAFDGTYEFSVSGAGDYKVVFGNGSDGRKFRGRPAGGNGQRSSNAVSTITLAAGQSATGVDGIAIDPSGVVYDTLTRTPIVGATVTFQYDNGGSWDPVPNTWLDTTLGDSNPATTGADGLYEFFLDSDAPDAPTQYRLVVAPTAGFSFPSSVIVKETGPLVPDLGGEIVAIQSQTDAPTGSELTTYYLDFTMQVTTDLATSSDGVINNHIPVDPDASGTESTLTASKSAILADGSDTSIITVQLKTSAGVSFTYGGNTVTISTTEGVITSTTDNGDGTYTASLSSAVTGSATISAVVDGSLITDTATVSFVDAVVDGAASSVNANPTTVAADGVATSSITVTIVDTDGDPMNGVTVTLSDGGAGTTISPASTVTDATGVATFSASHNSDATVTYSAVADGVSITDTAIVTFGAGSIGSPDPAQSTITVSPSTLPADGQQVATVVVTIKDAASTVLGGETVTLSVSGTDVTVSPTSVVTASNGTATFELSSTQPQVATLSATVTGSPAITLSQTPTVTFTATSGPTLVERVPANEATNVDPQTTLTLTFNQAIRAGEGGVRLETEEGEVLQALTSEDDAQFTDRTVTYSLREPLPPGTSVRVIIEEDAILSESGAPYVPSGEWTFQTATVETLFEDYREDVELTLNQQALRTTQRAAQDRTQWAASVRSRLVDLMNAPSALEPALCPAPVSGTDASVPRDTQSATATDACIEWGRTHVDASYDSLRHMDGFRAEMHTEAMIHPYNIRFDADASIGWTPNGGTQHEARQRLGIEQVIRGVSETTVGTAGYIALQQTRSTMKEPLTGSIETYGVALDLFAVTEISRNLYLDAYTSIGYDINRVNLTEDAMRLHGTYPSYSVIAGTSLSGDLLFDGGSLRPNLEIQTAYSWAGTPTLNATIFAVTEPVVVTIDPVWLFAATFAPELRFDLASNREEERREQQQLLLSPYGRCSLDVIMAGSAISCGYGVNAMYSLQDIETNEGIEMRIGYGTQDSASQIRFGVSVAVPYGGHGTHE